MREGIPAGEFVSFCRPQIHIETGRPFSAGELVERLPQTAAA